MGGCGWMWVGVGESGWLWVAVGGCGWVWVGVSGWVGGYGLIVEARLTQPLQSNSRTISIYYSKVPPHEVCI